MRRRALLLINSKARRGQEDLLQICDRLRDGGLDLVEPNDKPFDVHALVRQYSPQVDLVIVGGGDGSINHALSGLLESNKPLGILPLGTANDLARTLVLPTDLMLACDVILHGLTKQIDVGIVNNRPFLNVANVGLAAEVTRRLSRSTKSRWGVLAYAWAAFTAMLSGRSFSVEITCGGEVLRARTWQISVGNGRYYGGGLTIHEKATIDDGLLDLYSLEIRRRWQVLPLIPALWRGTLDPVLPVRTMHGTTIVIRPIHRSRRIVADGELIGRTPAVFSLLPRALSVFVPEPSANNSVES